MFQLLAQHLAPPLHSGRWVYVPMGVGAWEMRRRLCGLLSQPKSTLSFPPQKEHPDGSENSSVMEIAPNLFLFI